MTADNQSASSSPPAAVAAATTPTATIARIDEVIDSFSESIAVSLQSTFCSLVKSALLDHLLLCFIDMDVRWPKCHGFGVHRSNLLVDC